LRKIIESPYEPWPVAKNKGPKATDKKDPSNKDGTEKTTKKKEKDWNWKNTK